MKSGGKIKLIITDDSPAFLQGLELMLTSDERFEILDKCTNGRELYTNGNLDIADLLLIDIEMPVMNGLEAAIKISYDFPQIQMVAITTNVKTLFLKDIICAGFKGFIYKANIHNELFPTIDKVLNHQFVFPKELNL